MNHWLEWLDQLPAIAGFPLVVAGVGLMLFGWRMWKLCVVLAFGVIGGMICDYFIGPGEYRWIFILVSGVILGLLSYLPVNLSISALGGVVGAGLLTMSFRNLGMNGMTLAFLGCFAMVACTAIAYLHRQVVVVAITSFLGSISLMVGLSVWLMTIPGFRGQFQSLAADSFIVVPFIVIVPTVMSLFYQVAEVRRLSVQF